MFTITESKSGFKKFILGPRGFLAKHMKIARQVMCTIIKLLVVSIVATQ